MATTTPSSEQRPAAPHTPAGILTSEVPSRYVELIAPLQREPVEHADLLSHLLTIRLLLPDDLLAGLTVPPSYEAALTLIRRLAAAARRHRNER